MTILLRALFVYFLLVRATTGLYNDRSWNRTRDYEDSGAGELIEDIIDSKLYDNIIFISGENTMPLITDLIHKLSTKVQFTSTVISYEKIDEQLLVHPPYIPPSCFAVENRNKEIEALVKIKQMNVKDNKEPLFIITPPSLPFIWKIDLLLKAIKKYLFNPKIAIIFSKPQHVLASYKETKSIQLGFGLSNIFIFDPKLPEVSSKNSYHQIEICMFCERVMWGRLNSYNLVNDWQSSIGFQYPLKFPSSFKNNYFEDEIVFSTEFDTTNIWITRVEESGDIHNPCTFNYGGPMYEDFLMLSRMLNFSLVLKKVVGEQQISEDWRQVRDVLNIMNEVKEMAYKRRIGAVGGSSIASYEVHQMADISSPTFYQSGANIVTVEPLKTFRWYAILQPFSWYVWVVVIATVPLSGLALYVARKYSNNSSDRPRLRDAMWDAVTIICWDSIRVRQPSAATILLLLPYMLATTVLVSEYFSYYTSFMTTPAHITKPLDTKEQLWETQMDWIGGRMKNYYISYFNASVDDVENRLRYLSEKEMGEEIKTAIEIMIAHPDEYVYFEKQGLIEWNICQHEIDLMGRKMYYSKETIGDYNTYMYFQKGSITTEALNRKILLLHELGIIQMNQRRYVNNAARPSCYEKKEITVEAITLANMKSGFYFLILGYVLALISFLKEMMKKVKIKLSVEIVDKEK